MAKRKTSRRFDCVITGSTSLSAEALQLAMRVQPIFDGPSAAVNGDHEVRVTLGSVPLPKNASRPKRWGQACAVALSALERMEDVLSEFKSAVEDLNAVREDYAEWLANLPDNLQGSTLAEKLQAIEDMQLEDVATELETAVSDAKEKIEEADNAELPLGFGRD